jgi:branched-chain amino acid transport system substrate-binding protein
VAAITSVPVGIKDVSSILKEMKAAQVEALLSFCYPDENFLITQETIELEFNPKVFLTGPGSNFSFFEQTFGPAAEGIMSFGAWNAKVSPAHKALADKLAARYGPQIIDWWGHNLYYAGLQFMQQAIEKAGTLNQEKIREIFATAKFQTILGPTWFDEKHLLAVVCHSGEVGQWQHGLFEVIGPENKATAGIEYPKPPWPKKTK